MTVPGDIAEDAGYRRLSTTKQLCSMRRDVLGHVGNKWSSLVLTMLEERPRRYSEIRQSCDITPRMLTLTVHELEQDGLIGRAPAGGDGAQTSYVLTPAGRSLCVIIRSLISWSDHHRDYILDSRDRFAVAGAGGVRTRRP